MRRRAERRARRTQDPADCRTSRRAQKHIRRHLDKLSRKGWQTFCVSLDPRKPLSCVWRLSKGQHSTSQQCHAFLGLALSWHSSEIEVAEEYFSGLTKQNVGGSANSSWKTRHAPLTFWSSLDSPFTMNQLDTAIQSCQRPSSSGPDGITYAQLAHLELIGRDRLLIILICPRHLEKYQYSGKRGDFFPFSNLGSPFLTWFRVDLFSPLPPP